MRENPLPTSSSSRSIIILACQHAYGCAFARSRARTMALACWAAAFDIKRGGSARTNSSPTRPTQPTTGHPRLGQKSDKINRLLLALGAPQSISASTSQPPPHTLSSRAPVVHRVSLSRLAYQEETRSSRTPLHSMWSFFQGASVKNHLLPGVPGFEPRKDGRQVKWRKSDVFSRTRAYVETSSVQTHAHV